MAGHARHPGPPQRSPEAQMKGRGWDRPWPRTLSLGNPAGRQSACSRDEEPMSLSTLSESPHSSLIKSPSLRKSPQSRCHPRGSRVCGRAGSWALDPGRDSIAISENMAPVLADEHLTGISKREDKEISYLSRK